MKNTAVPRLVRRVSSYVLTGSIAAMCAFMGCSAARAANFYWDANGNLVTPVAATGTWGIDDFWSTSATGAAATSAQTITVGSSGSGGITLNGIIGNGGGGGTVALTVNSTSTGITTLTGANTYTGATTVKVGTLTLNPLHRCAGAAWWARPIVISL